jgi:hypothetical protein
MIAPFVKRSFGGKIPLPWTIVQGFPDSEVFIHPGKDVKYPHQKDHPEQIECQDKQRAGVLGEDKNPLPLSRGGHRVPGVSPAVIKSEGPDEEPRKNPFPKTEVRFPHFQVSWSWREGPSPGNVFRMCERSTQCAIQEHLRFHSIYPLFLS